MKKDVIANTEGNTRSVSFNENLDLMPVMFAVTTGPKSQRCTVQQLGPIVISKTFGGKNGKDKITCIGISFSEMPDTIKKIFKSHKWLEEFFEGTKEAILPVPREEWVATQNKEARIKEFCEKYGITINMEAAMKSPKKNLNFVPRKVTGDMDVKSFDIPEVHQTILWYGTDGDNTSAILLNSKEESDSKFIVRVIDGYNITTRNGKPESYGIRVDIFYKD